VRNQNNVGVRLPSAEESDAALWSILRWTKAL